MPDIFDELTVAKTPKRSDIFDQLEESPSRGRSLISAPIKGAVKGVEEISQVSDPLKGLLGIGGLNPHQKQILEQILPTQQRPLEKGLERAGRLAVQAAGGGESALAKGLRVAAGATAGQLSEEIGAPETVQSLAEFGGFISPSFGKKILPTAKQKDAVDFLRSKGLSEQQIAPLIKSEKSIKTLAKISEKGKKGKELVKGISQKLGESYETLKESYQNIAKPNLTGKEAMAFDDSLLSSLDKISPRFRRLVQPDVEALRNKGYSGESLINFYQDINAIVKGQEGGKAVLGKLKPIIKEGLEKIDPKLSKEFSQLNDFYAKKSLLSKSLKPGMIDQLISKGKSYALIASLATGNLGVLEGVLGKEAASRVFRELLINPRLQNLSNQMLEAIKKNRVPVAKKMFDVFKGVVGEENLDAFDSLSSVPEST